MYFFRQLIILSRTDVLTFINGESRNSICHVSLSELSIVDRWNVWHFFETPPATVTLFIRCYSSIEFRTFHRHMWRVRELHMC